MTEDPTERRLDFRGLPPDRIDLSPVVEHLRSGGLVVHPTETVYGLGALVRPRTIERVRSLKGRHGDKPFLLLVPDAESVPDLAWTDPARELARVFWPGALTLVLSDEGSRFPPGVRGATGGVAVRRTPHPLASRLVMLLGEPLISTSANAAGREPARSGDAAWAWIERVGTPPEVWLLDAGPLPPSPPSTIVDCTTDRPTVTRAGSVPSERLRCLLPDLDVSDR